MTILSFHLSENLYLRDFQDTGLGRNIIRKGARLFDKLGYGEFTFRKLAPEIGSTGASLYRYFENKHKLLISLIDWYWTWLEYSIVDHHINSVKVPESWLKICLTEVLEEKTNDSEIAYVDESALERIVAAEFEKTFLTKQVDADNQAGLFLPYRSLCKKIASDITEVNPEYEFPHSLASTVLLSVKHQLFYAEHLPTLSDIMYDPKKQHKRLYVFLENPAMKTLEK
jgi:AcrR family transcriptional regulator